MINFVLTLGRSWKAKNAKKAKQYFNCILMRINQNIVAILRTFLDLQKKYEKLYTKQTSTAATTEFPSKILNRKKISNKHFNLCEAEMSLHKIIKSINSETSIKSPDNEGLTAEF